MNPQIKTQTLETANTINVPRAGTKQAKLVIMLSRKTGVTLAKASDVLGWQHHTTSAAMTGLRRRGYIINIVERSDKDSLYVITPNPAQP